MPGRIVYLQFTNPGGYPALHHSSRIFAEAGWEVLFLGTEAFGTHALPLPPHRGIETRHLSFRPVGYRRKLLYLRFTLWVMAWSLRWRPRWIYASDPLSCPVALMLSHLTGAKVIYHEHDTPVELGAMTVGGACLASQEAGRVRSRTHRLLSRARSRLARRAAICILPNADRAAQFCESTGRQGAIRCIWNCPSRGEALEESVGQRGAILHYHGNLGPE
jgi:hypothetical protein